MGKIAKIFAVLSVVWLIIIFAIASDSFGFAWTEFVVVGLLPLVIGWGIYWVVKK
jgi:hypothetical protein